MELTFEPKTIRCLREILNKTIRREETAEAVVPDGEQDPDRVLACSANAVLRSKESRTGSAELNGGIQADVTYISSGEKQPRSLPVYLPFSVPLDAAQLTPESEIKVCTRIRSAEARIVHSRRIQVRVSLVVKICAYAACEETVLCPTDAPDAMQLKTTEYPMLLPTRYAETAVHVGEELMLPSGGAETTVLHYTVVPILTESRIAGDKAVFQGDVRLHVLYRSGEDEPKVFERKIPFSQLCMLDEVCENAQADFCMVLTGCELREDAGDTLQFEADLLAQCTVFDRIPVPLCEDAYAVRGTWQPEWKEYAFRNRLDCPTLGCVMRENAEIPGSSVLDVMTFCDCPEMERTEDRARLTVPMTVQVLYYDTNGELQRCMVQGKAETETALAENASCEASAVPGETTAQHTVAGLSLSCPVEILTECFADQTYRSISGGKLTEEEEAERRPSLVLRRARAGQPLWELAKQYRSTTEKIARANRFSGDAVPESSTVLIPL